MTTYKKEVLPAVTKPKRSGVLQKLKEDGGFWVPNSFIDLHARELGPRAVYIYCILARAVTTKFYPSVKELSYLCRISKPMVVDLLLELKRRKILNRFDLRRMRGFPDATRRLVEEIEDFDGVTPTAERLADLVAAELEQEQETAASPSETPMDL